MMQYVVFKSVSPEGEAFIRLDTIIAIQDALPPPNVPRCAKITTINGSFLVEGSVADFKLVFAAFVGQELDATFSSGD